MIQLPVNKTDFLLKDDITFLNFGSFGACPKPIFDDYIKWQYLLEAEPVQFIAFEGVNYLKDSRAALAKYINCGADDVVYVTNPTYAVNIVANSLHLQPEDEILTTDLEYGACDRTWRYYCKQTGAKYVRQHISLPIVSKQQIVEQFKAGYTSKTKAIFISHITSSTALILPVKEICEWAKSMGLITIVDGAHVPGHIPLDLQDIKADVYTGACHKWMMTPKGCTFFYVTPALQAIMEPLIVSWGYESAAPTGSQFLDYHQMIGTRDFSAFLTVPAALQYMQQHNWNDVSAACKQLVKDNYPVMCSMLNTKPICPITDEFLGQMCSTPINVAEPEKLQRLLFEKYKIEVPLMRHGTDVYLRFSINAFNSQADIDYLFSSIKKIGYLI